MSDLTLDNLLSSLSDNTELEKAASETPVENTEVSAADELKQTLTKEASDASMTGDNNMSNTGNAIADSILAMLETGIEKEAAHGDKGGNKVITDIDEMEAQHADRIKTTPREGKTVTEVAKELQQRGGGEKEDKVEGAQAAPEGNSEAAVAAVPSDIEKAAAVGELMEDGVNFEDAVAMVKQASEEIEAEVAEFEKAAAVDALIAEGVDFEDAVLLVKQASEEIEAESLEYSDLEKAAAVGELMAEDGLSFEDAAALVKEAALAGK